MGFSEHDFFLVDHLFSLGMNQTTPDGPCGPKKNHNPNWIHSGKLT